MPTSRDGGVAADVAPGLVLLARGRRHGRRTSMRTATLVLYALFVPAVVWLASRWTRRRDPAAIVLVIGFFGQWLPWALVPRIAFAYHFMPAVPFGCLGHRGGDGHGVRAGPRRTCDRGGVRRARDRILRLLLSDLHRVAAHSAGLREPDLVVELEVAPVSPQAPSGAWGGSSSSGGSGSTGRPAHPSSLWRAESPSRFSPSVATVPVRKTTPSRVSTSIWRPLTCGSSSRRLFTLIVIPESVTTSRRSATDPVRLRYPTPLEPRSCRPRS